MKQSDIDKLLPICTEIKTATREGENTADKVGGVLEKLAGAVTPDETLSGLAKKDLSNVSETVLRDKTGVYAAERIMYHIYADHSVSISEKKEDLPGVLSAAAEDHELTLYFATLNDSIGSSFSPAYVKILYGRKINYTAMFVGSDNYVHKVVIDEDGNLTKQYAYSFDDFATKEDIEKIKLGDLTSQGYLPTRIVDLGEYSSSEGFVFTDPLLSELAAAMNAVSEGKATLLLKGSTPYGDPLFFSGVSVRIDAGIDYRLTFLMSNGRSYRISFEAGYPDSVQQGFTEGGGSGTITSEAYTDNKDYKEI